MAIEQDFDVRPTSLRCGKLWLGTQGKESRCGFGVSATQVTCGKSQPLFHKADGWSNGPRVQGSRGPIAQWSNVCQRCVSHIGCVFAQAWTSLRTSKRWPCSLAALQSYSLAALQPCSLTIDDSDGEDEPMP